MKNLILILLLGGAALPLPAADITITVLDDADGTPVPDVTVRWGDRKATTDDAGKLHLSNVGSGVHLHFSHPGYRPVTATLKEIGAQSHIVRMHSHVFSGTVTVTGASKRQEGRDSVPARIAQISKDEIALQNPQTAADMLGDSGEVYIQKSQLGGGSPMIRGFSTNRILLVVDGVRMNNAIYRSGNLQNVISLDTFAVERAEIIFGPGSTVYGSDAIGGVMSFTTLEPTFRGEGTGLVDAGAAARMSSANGELTGHADIMYGGAHWGGVTSLTFSDYGDQRMGSSGREDYLRREIVERIGGRDVIVSNSDPELQIPTGYEQMNLMQKLRWSGSEYWIVDYAAHVAATGDVPRYDRLIERRDGVLSNAEWFYGPQKWQMHSLQARYAGGSRMFDSAGITLAYQNYEESRNDRRLNSPWLRQRTENVDAWSLNVDLDKAVGRDGRLYYGFEAVWNEVGSRALATNIVNGETRAESTRYPDGSTWASYAAYATWTRPLNDQTTLVLGGRYNHVYVDATLDRTFFPFPFETIDIGTGAITGSAGITWRPDEKLQIHLNTATGFRAPNIDDAAKVFDSSPGTVVVPNGDLKSEYVWSVDSQAIVWLTGNVQAEAAVFYSYLQDAMVRRDFRFNGQEFILYDGELSRVQAVVNADSASVYGAQLALRADLTSELGLRANLTLMDGETGTGEPIRHVSPSFGTISLGWQRPRWRVEVSAEFNGEISFEDLAPSERDKIHIYALDDEGNPFSPGWATISAKAQFNINERLQIDAGLENLLDERYRPYSSGIVAPGLNAIIALRVVY